MKLKLIIAALALILIIMLAGCGKAVVSGVSPSINTGISSEPQLPQDKPQQSADTTLKPVDNPSPAKPAIASVSTLVDRSAEFVGREVIVEGKIVQECGSGCWFNLKDATGIVFVDLAPNNMTIPQKIGAKAKVYGTVNIKNGITYIVGRKVEF